MDYREIETKYNAESIAVSDFTQFAASLGEYREESVKSYDFYYVKKDAFIRYREGEIPELTMKRKDEKTNNFVRTEVNLKVHPGQGRPIIEKFCGMLGYRQDFKIFKTSLIYWYDKFNIVYYIVYDDETEAKELGRFIEIEMSEHGAWSDEESAWAELRRIEQGMSGIGLSPQRRIRKSLFEMFRT